VPRETPIGMIKNKGKDLYKDLKLTISLKYPRIKAYISVKKNRAARDALMTAGSAAIISKYNAIGRPASVPKPFTVPAIPPTKNFERL
tara:strand:- start:13 stop:276 length:264 start_codon:yes stop_codon:yes gene_type:complete